MPAGWTDSSGGDGRSTRFWPRPRPFSPSGGTYSAAQTVTLSSTTTGATIRYTTDGSAPNETAGSGLCARRFTVSGTTHREGHRIR